MPGSNLHQKVETRLKNLIVNKDQELADLIYDLGYEYENESYTSLFSDWTENQRSIINQITRLGYHGDFSIFWVINARSKSDKLSLTDPSEIFTISFKEFSEIFPFSKRDIFFKKFKSKSDFILVKSNL